MSEITDTLERLKQINRELYSLEGRIKDLPQEVIGRHPRSDILRLVDGIEATIEDLEEKS